MKQRKTEHPILFSTPMVQAILDGRKTMTRRILNPQPSDHYFQSLVLHATGKYTFAPSGNFNPTDSDILAVKFPFGEIGDKLWVREEHKVYFDSATREWVCEFKDGTIIRRYYKSISLKTNKNLMRRKTLGKWQRARFMPKDLCRIWLEITDVRVELLQEIKRTGALAEGIREYTLLEDTPHEETYYRFEFSGSDNPSAVHAFEALWCKINGDESWNANPWVWVIEFKRIDHGK